MASRNTGTYGINDLLAARFKSEAQWDDDTIVEILQRDLAFHRMNTLDTIALLAEPTFDRQRRQGSSLNIRGQIVDEYGGARTQKRTPGGEVAFPLRKYQYPTGWTRQWLLQAAPADIAGTQISVRNENLRNVVSAIKNAIYLSSNYSFDDDLVDTVSFTIRRLTNADGEPIPDNPQTGESFDASTHTHYNFSASLTTTAADALIEDVKEHSVNADIIIAIDSSDASDWRGLSGFQELPPETTRIFRNTAAEDVPEGNIPRGVTSNYPIGIYNTAWIWIKPWAIADYALAVDLNNDKPAAFRELEALPGLTMAEPTTANPLRVEDMEHQFGAGGNGRQSAAVLFHNGGSYVDPSIPLT